MAEAINPTTAKSDFKIADYAPTYGALAALVLLIVLNVLFTQNFADAGNFRNILVQVTPTMLVAVGMTFVIATGGINLSVGSVMAIDFGGGGSFARLRRGRGNCFGIVGGFANRRV